jgi:beta-xylosidase
MPVMRVKRLGLLTATALVLAGPALAAPRPEGAAVYRNPILPADYSDPDIIRVGETYYLVASSFHFSPGVPILTSKDLVHWTIAGHVLPKLPFAPEYDLPGPVPTDDAGARMPREMRASGQRYAGGVWAPSIRHHDGKFYVYFATPYEGVFMSTATKVEGPWSAPVAVVAGPGFEDPCPFWDEDGQAYLVHGKVGAGPLVLHRMAPDGKSVLDGGTVIVEDAKVLPVLEGPKLYKRNGWYYIFAPIGGVETGPQAVMRSKSIWGPYEHREVLVARQRAEGAAPGRLGRDTLGAGLVHPLQQRRRLRPHRPSAAAGLEGRLAVHRRAHPWRGAGRHRRPARRGARHAGRRQAL